MTLMRKLTALAGALAASFALAAAAQAATISNVVFTPDTPENLDYGEYVSFTFDYDLSDVGTTATIFGRPFTGGDLSPNYAAHPSPFYAAGSSGSGNGFFTLSSGVGQTLVDQVVFRIFADNVTQIYELVIDTHFLYGKASEVPLPAALPLFAAGLAGLGFAGRRRKKA
ncbi:MAG: VPLPA-CTERM sorting domain-containing protein [Parvularculaceae bacterium]